MTEAEIAGYMGWRGPGAYTQHQMRKVKTVVAEALRREREAIKNELSDIADQNVGHDDQFAKDIYFCVSVVSARGNT